MARAEKTRRLMQLAAQYQEAMRKKLEGIVQPGRFNMDPLGAAHPNPPGTMGQNWRFGQTIGDQDVLRFIRGSGGNPYLKQLQELQSRDKTKTGTGTGRKGRDVNAKAAEAEKTLMEQLAADYQAQLDAANAANEARYQEGHGELSTLRERNAERVKNFGQAAKADLEERFATSLGDVTANLSGRGLGNSTILSAFEAKNARDAAREQQRLSEMVDDRAARYDTADTQNLVGFVERRDDIAPDFAQLANLAQAYGASGASGETDSGAGAAWGGGAQQAAAPAQQPVQQQRAPVQYGVSPWAAQQIAGSYQGLYGNPLANLFPQRQATVSNRYPMRRTPEQYAALQTNLPVTQPRQQQSTQRPVDLIRLGQEYWNRNGPFYPR